MTFFTPVMDYDVTQNTHYQNHTMPKQSWVLTSYLPIKIDKTRMDKALSATSVKMPKGLTKEQRHQFMLNRAKQL